jgi:O-antigen/teichoic acid export membrane protein
MALCTFIQTTSTLLFNLVFYFYSVTDAAGIELILSSILGQFSRMISELLFLKIGLTGVFFAFRQKYSIRLVRKYYDFAIYSLPACFITSLQVGLPVYVLGLLFSDESVGQYALANRVLMVPLTVVGTALSQVLLKHFSEKLNSGENILGTLYRAWGISLSVVLIPAVVLFLSAEAIMSFIFGAQWVIAGQIVSILIIPVLINFCLNITSVSHVVLRMQDIAFYFSIAMLAAKLILTFQLSVHYFMLLLAYSFIDMIGIVLINLILIYRLKKTANENINVA